MKRMSTVLLVHTDRDAWHLGPGQSKGTKCDARFFHVVSIRDDTMLNGILQLDYTSRFQTEGAVLSTLPPTILTIEGTEGHREPRVIPSDHSHAFPVFEKFLQAPQPQ